MDGHDGQDPRHHWRCVVMRLVLFDDVQNAVNGLANVLFAGWSLLDIAFLSVPGIALVVIGTKIRSQSSFDLC
jgi:hypothetical protein